MVDHANTCLREEVGGGRLREEQLRVVLDEMEK